MNKFKEKIKLIEEALLKPASATDIENRTITILNILWKKILDAINNINGLTIYYDIPFKFSLTYNAASIEYDITNLNLEHQYHVDKMIDEIIEEIRMFPEAIDILDKRGLKFERDYKFIEYPLKSNKHFTPHMLMVNGLHRSYMLSSNFDINKFMTMDMDLLKVGKNR